MNENKETSQDDSVCMILHVETLEIFDKAEFDMTFVVQDLLL